MGTAVASGCVPGGQGWAPADVVFGLGRDFMQRCIGVQPTAKDPEAKRAKEKLRPGRCRLAPRAAVPVGPVCASPMRGQLRSGGGSTLDRVPPAALSADTSSEPAFSLSSPSVFAKLDMAGALGRSDPGASPPPMSAWPPPAAVRR